MPRDAEFVGDAVAAQHVAGGARDVERLAAGVALHDRGELDRRWPSSFMRPRRRQPCRPSAISVSMSASFFWISWLAASGRPNCLRSSTYCRAAVPAGLGGAQRAPGDAVARAVQAGERAFESAHLREERSLPGTNTSSMHDFAGDRGAQADLAVDRRARDRPFQPFSRMKPRMSPVIVLGPDHEHIGDRRVGDPHLRAREAIAARRPSAPA